VSAWAIVLICLAGGATLAGAVWLGRRWQAGRQAEATSAAQARMAEHRDSSDSASTDRMRDGRW